MPSPLPSSTLFPYTTLFRSCLLLRLFVFRLLRLKRFSTLTLKVLNLFSRSRRSEERISRNAETDLVCRLILEKKNAQKRSFPESTNRKTRTTYRFIDSQPYR